MSKLDLNRHGNICAHAGTGKTYLIEHSVADILSSKNADGSFIGVGQILVVTYTDKAAGELKKRIREQLKIRSGKEADLALKTHLEACLNTLHEAWIGTIHGTCAKILRTWPFETSSNFKTDPIDDGDGIAEIVREHVRNKWYDPSLHIPQALVALENADEFFSSSWLETIGTLAESILDSDHTRLDYTNATENLKTLLEQCATETAQVNYLREGFTSDLMVYFNLLEELSNDPDYNLATELKDHLAQLKEEWESEIDNPKWLVKLDKIGKKKILAKTDKAHKALKLFQEITGNLMFEGTHPYIKALENLNITKNSLKTRLFYDLAIFARDAWLERKKTLGLLSFQDMLQQLDIATENPAFVDLIRNRIRYGIIDEFQDTSVLQWSIFRKLFLGAQKNGPKLYLVGDPKQSIYSYQGANISTYISATQELVKAGATTYSLVENYRSQASLIDGYNLILGPVDGVDWFLSQQIQYPLIHPKGSEEMARAPKREVELQMPPEHIPIQVAIVQGDSDTRLAQFAEIAAQQVQQLCGQQVQLPKGADFENKTLAYGDFAVVVQNNGMAQVFLEKFQKSGIPAMKYKMEGVFSSQMANDLQIFLRAIADPEAGPGLCLPVLLTHFYNRRPTEVDPIADLEPGSEIMIHLEILRPMAARGQWGLLFRKLAELSNVFQRLLSLTDGQRLVADLRQVIDFCIDVLVRESIGLHQLVEKLALMHSKKESVSRDKNLHTLSTENSSVVILTMHTSKGLEFPVVFVATGSSDHSGNDNIFHWIDEDNKRVTSYGFKPSYCGPDQQTFTAGKMGFEIVSASKKFENIQKFQHRQERRRLLYVALTRAKYMMYVPLHCASMTHDDSGKYDLSTYTYDGRIVKEDDLSPRLLRLCKAGLQVLPWRAPVKGNAGIIQNHLPDPLPSKGATECERVLLRARLKTLNPVSRATTQTSYTELTHGKASDRSLDPSQEPEREVAPKPVSVLPLGAGTGIALHKLLEVSMLGDLSWVESGILPPTIEKLLSSLFKDTNAQDMARQILCRVLSDTLDISEIGGPASLRLMDLPQGDRRPEVDFQQWFGGAWLHGSLDLVFRFQDRYYILDWKSNALPKYDLPHIEASIFADRYDCQAGLYGQALDKFLETHPDHHFAGAVYVYLRGYEQAHHVPIWLEKRKPTELYADSLKLLQEANTDA